MEVLPDGSGLRYQRRHEEGDGAETCLEVKVGLKGSTTITTRRTGRTEKTSNEISVQLVGGSNQVNIQQTSQKEPVPTTTSKQGVNQKTTNFYLAAVSRRT